MKSVKKTNKIQIGTKDMAHWSTMTSSYVITDHVLGEVTKTKKIGHIWRVDFFCDVSKGSTTAFNFSQLIETTNTWCELQFGKISDKWQRNRNKMSCR